MILPGPALSIVVPVYDEEGNVAPLHAELTAVARGLGLPYEILFVNAGTTTSGSSTSTATSARRPRSRRDSSMRAAP